MTDTQEQAEQLAGQAKEKASEAAGQAKGRVREEVDLRSTQAGEQLAAQAKDVRAVADSLREQGKEQPAKLADQAADRAERLGSYLSRSSGETILHDLEDLGRQQPMAVIAGGLVLGFAASRFLKASSEKRYETARTGGQPAAPAPALPPAGIGYGTPPVPDAEVPTTGYSTPPLDGAR